MQSGELTRLQAWGLRYVRAHGRAGAAAADGGVPFPVLLLSPGQATNAEFYASLAEDLASHGFVVVVVGHTYENVATSFPDGRLLGCASCEVPHDEAFW